jgi:hypothetical protein
VLHWPLAEALLEFEAIVIRRALRSHQLTILSWQLGHEEGAAAPQTPAVLRRDGVEE